MQGGVPLVVYPGKCWYDGCCVDHCPVPGALALDTQLFNKVHWEASKAPSDQAIQGQRHHATKTGSFTPCRLRGDNALSR